ncbi:MAG: hypothetical protein MJY58_02800 [Bacteroidaceae bacterium]|nr:hypothetical protein [Bacteroidaceae bacterium]
MKTKIITTVAIAFMTFGLMSCDNDTRTLRSEIAEEVNMYSGEFYIDHWTKVSDSHGLNTYYKADVRIPKITCNVLNWGQINCYLYTGRDSQMTLPCVRHYENEQGDRWTSTIDCEYWDGGLTVYVTDSDFAGGIPDRMSFRIMLSW